MSWLFGNKKQKYIENLEKNNKIREEKEREESDIIAIGKISPETQEKREIERELSKGSEEMKPIKASQQKELKSKQDQLFVIDGAKVKFGPHIGTFKVLNRTPTIQSKTIGTEIEKSPANFTFMDGFQLLTLTQWQDVGTVKFQDNLALIKKSTIMGTGKMPPANAPIESGKIEFIDSGQINVPAGIDTTGIPIPEYVPKSQTIEIYYTNLEGDKIEEAIIGEEIYLVLESKNMIGQVIDVDLSDNTRDFEYEGQILKDDILKNLTINKNIQQERLKVIPQQKQ
ncbi:hypothetical protein [Capnocytophaga genosp. AHN8471]|uniref:hypothetical protein n=1 Tax=Capnocytophaga genosp. AHN8471 TaxID=327574 RepID=UPI001EE3AD60|nr:hypothetical protein [Capnocytophaga genosp. AHN8471]